MFGMSEAAPCSARDLSQFGDMLATPRLYTILSSPVSFVDVSHPITSYINDCSH